MTSPRPGGVGRTPLLARTDSRARALFLLLVAAIVATGIGTRLAWWQIVERDPLVSRALDQLAQNQEIPAERGEITDASGVLLATSVELQSIFATPPSVEDPESTAALLAPALGMHVDALRDLLTSADKWVWLKRRVDLSVSDRIRDMGLAGIGMLPETKRVYPVQGISPRTTLAAQVIGFVNVDGVGQYGIESAEDDLLAGLPGSVTAQEDVIGRQIADSIRELRPSVDGSDIQLTIDAGLQHLMEAAMWGTYRRNAAQGVTGVVMDVKTGAVLALATFPSYDANKYGTLDPEVFTNPAVSSQYEPGSVMKAFTVAAALDAGAITTRDKFRDNNNLVIGDVRIQNADRYTSPYGHGAITAGDVLKLSNNVGAAKIGLTLGRDQLYQALRRFGFGERTGIEISGEAPGVVWNPDGPDRRPERVRPGPVGDRHAAGGRLRGHRQWRGAGDAARGRRLDHARRRRPRGGPASAAAHHARRDRGHRPAAADRRRGLRDRPAGVDPGLLGGWQDRDRPDRRSDHDPRPHRDR
jgi:cell division protein FtsI/penicillin-binding protein 2